MRREVAVKCCVDGVYTYIVCGSIRQSSISMYDSLCVGVLQVLVAIEIYKVERTSTISFHFNSSIHPPIVKYYDYFCQTLVIFNIYLIIMLIYNCDLHIYWVAWYLLCT